MSTTIRTALATLFFSALQVVADDHLQESLARSVTALRSENNPLITFESSPTLGDNINGASVIRVPNWIENPLGKYYMYFAHHEGKHIRLAYADQITGPWLVFEPGVLPVSQVSEIKGHIASPDVHVDDEKKKIWMYFHGPAKQSDGQKTFVAKSKDGLSFEAKGHELGASYFRMFKWQDHFYAVDGKGNLNRSISADSSWQKRKEKLIHPVAIEDVYGKREVKVRHPAVYLNDEFLYIFYTRVGDAPERILVSAVRLTDDWAEWETSDPVEVIRPEAEYEGIQFALQPSAMGQESGVRQLRDPYVFGKGGKLYLFYSIAGEMGIAIAELSVEDLVEQVGGIEPAAAVGPNSQ